MSRGRGSRPNALGSHQTGGWGRLRLTQNSSRRPSALGSVRRRSQRGGLARAASTSAAAAARFSAIRAFAAVTFSVRVCGRHGAESALSSHEADIAIVHEGHWGTGLQIVAEHRQVINLLCHEQHDLAGEGALRLRDCLGYPMALPTRSNGVRYLLEKAADRLQRPLPIAIESDNFGFLRRCLADEGTISFQVPVALPRSMAVERLCRREVDGRDLAGGRLLVGQLKGRTLPVAAARFLERVVTALERDESPIG